MVKRILLLLVSLHTLYSADNIIVIFPSMLDHQAASVSGRRYAHTSETTVGSILASSKDYYLSNMSSLFNEKIKDATFFLAASYFCTQPSFVCYEDSEPLEQDNTISDVKKMYQTDRFTLQYSYPKKQKKKRLASTR